MKISQELWQTVAVNFKNRLLAKFDPTTLIAPEDDSLRSKFVIPHKGFYILIFDGSNKKVARVGFMEENQENIINSGNKAIEALYVDLKAQDVPYKKLLTCVFNFVVIWDSVFINNGLNWDENVDGIYFSWGDRYKGFYLPLEIKQMMIPKIEILNRLCSWEAGVPSNLWRLPEGLCFKLVCDSFKL